MSKGSFVRQVSHAIPVCIASIWMLVCVGLASSVDILDEQAEFLLIGSVGFCYFVFGYSGYNAYLHKGGAESLSKSVLYTFIYGFVLFWWWFRKSLRNLL